MVSAKFTIRQSKLINTHIL